MFLCLGLLFLWLSLGRNQYRREGLWFVCLLYDGSTWRLTESGFMWFYVFFMEKPGIEPATPGLQGIALIHYIGLLLHWKSFCGFPWVETSTAGRVYDLCVYYMTGAPEGSPKVVLCGFFFYGFMEKPGIEPATPGLQGIALIHYTTGASTELKMQS